jgi:osmoprotectant transport system ATP-binding protein
VGGILEQLDSPAEMLRAPRNDFVADFLGDDRGIKRLSLMTVEDASLSKGPVVAGSATTAEARAAMAELGYDWVAVCDDDRLRGWIGAAELDGAATVDELTPKPFRAVVTADTNLKAALDGIVSSHTRVAMVVDADGRYLGMLTVDDLAEGIVA